MRVVLWRRRRRPGWMALVWADRGLAGEELRQVLFYDGNRDDAWWAAQEWVAEHGIRN